MAQERQKNWLTFLFRDTSLVAVAIVCSSLVFVVFERIVVGIDTGGCMGTVELEAHEDDSQAHTDQSDRDDGQVEVSGEQETDEQERSHTLLDHHGEQQGQAVGGHDLGRNVKTVDSHSGTMLTMA
mgnify:CR=1 FL=1